MIKKPTKRQLQYWDNILHDYKLGEGRGRSSLVDYEGSAEDLNAIERKIISKKTGRANPKGRAD